MASGTISKNVGKLSSGTVLFVEWKIENFLSLPHKVDSYVRSSSFQFKGRHFYLQAYPNGESHNDTEGYVDIYIMQHLSGPSTLYISYHIGISKSDGTVYDSWFDEENFVNDASGYGVYGLVKRSVIRDRGNELTPNGVLTFFCYLQVKSGGTSDASTQTFLLVDNGACCDTKVESMICHKGTGAHKLAKNLKDLLLSKEDCDIILKVKNQEFQAHKTILVARSPVFSSMFRHEMAEKLSGEVSIADCDPDAFQLFLIYLYTGTVEDLASDNVFNLYEIANKYDATDLRVNCTDYMKCNLSVETVCDVISLSLLHNETDLLDMATEFFTKHLKDIIVTIKWRCFLEENIATANELLIKASKYHCPPK